MPKLTLPTSPQDEALTPFPTTTQVVIQGSPNKWISPFFYTDIF